MIPLFQSVMGKGVKSTTYNGSVPAV